MNGDTYFWYRDNLDNLTKKLEDTLVEAMLNMGDDVKAVDYFTATEVAIIYNRARQRAMNKYCEETDYRSRKLKKDGNN